MKAHSLEIPMHLRKGHALQDLRSAQRVSLDCRMTYNVEGEPIEEGILRDLSKTGCQILSLQPPPAGSQPMWLEGTTVSWVQGQRFGGRFRPLTSSERRRMQTAVLQRVTFSRSGLQRTAFRLV